MPHSNHWYIISLWGMVTDFMAVSLAWVMFFIYRKSVVDPSQTIKEIVSDQQLFIGLITIPTFLVFYFWLTGSYHRPDQKSWLQLGMTSLWQLISGLLPILLFVLVDDDTLSYITYLQSYIVLLSISLIILLLFRYLYIFIINIYLKNNKKISVAYMGWAHLPTHLIDKDKQAKIYDNLGNFYEQNFDELVVHITDGKLLSKLPDIASCFSPNTVVRLSIDEGVTLTNTRLRYDSDHRFVRWEMHVMPLWQRHLKRTIDVLSSIVALTILSPVMVYTFMRIKLNDSGSGIYHQKRVGRHGREFTIHKFRSMIENAEFDGPQLSYDGDDRCTPLGRWMRKYRIDELPQFWNVLRGDMSLVGPRPERHYYLKKIMEHRPETTRLLAVRPGITSWGQVKFGYAKNLQEMLKRVQFDLLYLENQNLFLDFNILLRTIQVMWRGQGQ